jgi:hypothetical protein
MFRSILSRCLFVFAIAPPLLHAQESTPPLAFPPGYSNARTATDPAKPHPACRPTELRISHTHYSISVEWDLKGDTNHNATCQVQYRRADEPGWHDAFPLLRVDYFGWYGNDRPAVRGFNMLAGSILFLRPGAEYEIRLQLADPDNAAPDAETRRVRLKPLPAFANPARRLHVVPGASDSPKGDGTEQNPFRSLGAALGTAGAGDLLLLHAGSYGAATISRGGEPGSANSATDDTKYLALRAAGDGAVVFDSLRLEAGHVWLESLTFQKRDEATGLKDNTGAENVVVRGCTFRDYHYSVLLSPKSRGWYISDNDIVGDTTKGISGEGIELSKSSDHTVCYNRIQRSADGVSYARTNCDLFGNDIFDMSDDPLEPDYGYANIRIWGNRLHGHTGVSFQPMYCGPWYLIRNQIVSNFVFKLRVQDRFVMVNNTLAGRVPLAHAHGLLTAYSRNNLWTHLGGTEFLWVSQAPGDEAKRVYLVKNTLFDSPVANWKSDLDYDGFDVTAAKPNAKLKGISAFVWIDRRFAELPQLAKALGIEPHARTLDRAHTFQPFTINPDTPGAEIPSLQLCANSEAQDAGVPVPNLSEEFAGAAPDLGAFELGAPLLVHGPRTNPDSPEAAQAWVLKHQRQDSHSIK